jgi:hypothetical protein
MSARNKTKLFTLTSTSHSLADILASPNDSFVGSLTLRAAKTNAGDLTWADTAGDPGGYLEPREAASFDLTGKYVATSSWLLQGTIGDKVYITVIG